MNNKNIKFLFNLSIFVLLCWGPHAWFTWQWDGMENVAMMALYGLFALIAFAYMRAQKIEFKAKFTLILVFLLFLFGTYMSKIGMTTIPLVFLQIFPLYVLLSDNEGIDEHVHFLNKALCVLFVPGLIIHVVFLLGASFPSVPIQYKDNLNYIFFNYFVDVVPVVNEGTYRFQSVFLEPGYLGTLLAFMLYANRYDFKKWPVRIMVIALLFSFSLAGYITTVFGYLMCSYSQGKNSRRYISFVALLLVLYYGSQLYNDGDNTINNLIVERLQLDDEVGIAGNNRFAENTRNNFEYYMESGGLLFGVEGLEESDYAGAGYMRYFLAYGIISAVLFLIMYIILGRICVNKKYAWGFIVLICITFLQAAYPSSYSWLIPFLLGLKYENKLKLTS